MTKNWKYALLLTGTFFCTTAYAQTLQDGKRALETERYKEAKSKLAKVLKTNNNEATNMTMGDVYLQTGKQDSAIYYYNRAASIDAKSAMGMVAAGKAALLRNDPTEAENQFEAALKRSKSKDAEVLKQIAAAYYQTNKNLVKAAEYATKSLTISRDPETYVLLGDIYLKQDKGGDAMTSYENSLRVNPKYLLGHLRKGQLSVRSKAFPAAQTAYTSILETDPNYAPAYRYLGELYYFAGKYDLALQNYQKYVDLAEQTPETRAVYASFLYLTNKFEETVSEAEKVLQKDPDNMVMKRLLAYSLYETNKNDRALTAMQDYFKTTPQDKVLPTDYAYYGKILAKANKPEEAVANLNKALTMDPANNELRTELADLYVKQDKVPQAINLYLQKMRSSEPTNMDYYKLGDYYERAKNYKSADSSYAFINKRNAEFAPAYIWRARANANLDPDSKQGMAKPHYEKYIEVATASPEKDKYKDGLVEANYYLGYYYYLKNDKAKSTSHLKEVLAMDPTNNQAKTLMDVWSGNVKTKTKVKTK